MTRTSRHNLLLAGVAMTSLALVAGAQAQSKGSSTAQSVQIAFDTDISSLLIEGSETWAYPGGSTDFNTYFDLQIVSGTPNSGQQNATRNEAFTDNACNFWNGTALDEVTRSFGGGVVVKAVPKAPGVYPARTRWTQTDNSPGDPVDLDAYDIFVAAESYLKNNQKKGGWTDKYSFSMGSTSNSRLASLTIELLQDGEPVDTQVLGTDFVQQVVSGETWSYVGNGGQFGTDPAALNRLQDGEVEDILLDDDFPGNDGAGGGRAFIDDLTYMLVDEGAYALRFSGVVKGNTVEDVRSQAFNVTESFVLLGVDCD